MEGTRDPNKEKEMKLRCYCCGKPVFDEVVLATASADEVDRVFILLPEHKDRVEGGSTEIVTRVPGPFRTRKKK